MPCPQHITRHESFGYMDDDIENPSRWFILIELQIVVLKFSRYTTLERPVLVVLFIQFVYKNDVYRFQFVLKFDI